MKNIILKFVTLILFLTTIIACNKEDENRFRPGSAHKNQETEEGTGFSTLTKENHPRLFINQKQFDELKDKINANPKANIALLHNIIMSVCNGSGMKNTQLEYKLDASNKRILDVSRNALLRIFSCAYAYKITGDSKYLTHAENDINTVCSFTDWNSKRHFLDVAEMATGVAIGYDWLYNDLKQETKSKAEKALVNFAMKQAIDKNWNLNFYEADNNWNQVCNAGLVCAALAIYETAADQAKTIIEKAVESNKPALETMYSPDGNYPEGPGYWCYGTLYEVMMLAAFDSTLGNDYGLSSVSGFSKTAEYMLYMTGMNSNFFNYSDCSSYSTPALANWWFAKKYNTPSLLFNEMRMVKNGEYPNSAESRLLPLIMTFAKDINIDNINAPTEKIWKGDGITPVLVVHTDWTFSNSDKYLGIKGGKAENSHAHMDAGSFVYDAYGVRWSEDLGLQSYTTLESPLAALGGNLWDMGQNSMRWNVFRLNNKSHSTLTINDANHRVNGFASIVSKISTNNELGGVIDITDVVSDQAASAIRTIKIVDDKDLVVIDEIKARPDKSAKVRWIMATPAKPNVMSGKIELTFNGKTMYLSTKSSIKITYKEWSAQGSNSYDASNPGKYLVGFEGEIIANQNATFNTVLTPKQN